MSVLLLDYIPCWNNAKKSLAILLGSLGVSGIYFTCLIFLKITKGLTSDEVI